MPKRILERRFYRGGHIAAMISWAFEPRDLWIGVYWTTDCGLHKVYVCLVPTLPILIAWWGKSA